MDNIKLLGDKCAAYNTLKVKLYIDIGKEKLPYKPYGYNPFGYLYNTRKEMINIGNR